MQAVRDCHSAFPSSKGQWTLAFRSDDESPEQPPSDSLPAPVSSPFHRREKNLADRQAGK